MCTITRLRYSCPFHVLLDVTVKVRNEVVCAVPCLVLICSSQISGGQGDVGSIQQAVSHIKLGSARRGYRLDLPLSGKIKLLY